MSRSRHRADPLIRASEGGTAPDDLLLRLSDLVSACALGCQHLQAELSEGLQRLIADQTGHASDARPRLLKDMQYLDPITQILEETARMLAEAETREARPVSPPKLNLISDHLGSDARAPAAQLWERMKNPTAQDGTATDEIFA